MMKQSVQAGVSVNSILSLCKIYDLFYATKAFHNNAHNH